MQTSVTTGADRYRRGAVPGRPVRRSSRAAAAALLVLAVLAGCSSGQVAPPAVPTAADGPDAGLAGVRAPSGTPGGTLRVVTAQVDSLDPQRSYVPSVWNLMRLYVRTLVTYSSAPGATEELVPDLATDLGTTPDGGLTWTFTLREGGTFENGRPITSRDVKYGIERSFASDVITGGPNYVVELLDDPADPYAGPYQDESPDRLSLPSIETPDDRTIVFRLRAPEPDFPYVLALPSSSPVPVEVDSGAAYGQDPVSSGPYVITSTDPVTGIVFDRNVNWAPASDGLRTALPDRVVVRTGVSGLDRDQALLSGAADVDIAGTGVQQATAVRIAADRALQDRVDDVTTGAVRMLALPTTVAPFTDPNCRAAVAAVVDRSAVQEALGGAGAAVRTSQLWPRGLPGGPEEADPQPDADAARVALAACGLPDGFGTVLAVPDAPMLVAAATSLAADLAGVGIVAEVRPLDARSFYATEVGRPENVLAQGYGMVLATWTADFPTAGSFLVPLVDGRSVRPVGNTNYAQLADPAVNALIDGAKVAPDPAAATAGWAQVAQSAVGTGSYVPLAETRVQLVAGQRLRNGVVLLPYGGYDLATAGVG